MKKRLPSRFEKEWVTGNRGRVLQYPLVDGDYQSSYFFGLLEEFEIALKERLPITLGIALLCAIEQAGREVLRFEHPHRDRFDNRECFDEVLHHYMGYRKIATNRYDVFRNGLIHSGLPKSEGGGGVGVEVSAVFLSRKKLKRVRGLHIHRDGSHDVSLEVLVKEFESGVRKLRRHEIAHGWCYTIKK